MDFIVIPTITFKLLYAFFIIDHKRRKIIHVNTTYNPTAFWVQQQLREAFPFDDHPDYMILDNDKIFSDAVLKTMENIGITPKKTSIRSPWQNQSSEEVTQIVSQRKQLQPDLIGFESLTGASLRFVI